MGHMLSLFDSRSSIDALLGALDADGVAGIKGVIDPGLIERIDADLAPYLEAERERLDRLGPAAKGPARVGAVLAKTNNIVPLLQSRLINRISERFLLPHCSSYQLSAVHLIEVQAHSPQGAVHRDDVIWPMKGPRPVAVINFLIPVTDFTPENGGTLVVPGSHLWPRDETKIGPGRLDLDVTEPVAADQLVTAPLPRGSVMPVLGGVLHCSGANTTDRPRRALSVSVMLGWLRQEENLYLSVPRERLHDLPEDVVKLIGYRIHEPYLGHTGFD